MNKIVLQNQDLARIAYLCYPPQINCRKVEGNSTFAALVDMSKAFDFINHNMIYYKLLTRNINGNFHYAVLALNRETEPCVMFGCLITSLGIQSMYGVLLFCMTL